MELSEDDIQYLRKIWKMGRRPSVFEKDGCGLGKKYDLPEMAEEQIPETPSEFSKADIYVKE